MSLFKRQPAPQEQLPGQDDTGDFIADSPPEEPLPVPEVPAYTEPADIGSEEYFLSLHEVNSLAAHSRAETGLLANIRGTTIATINEQITSTATDRMTKRELIRSNLAVRAVNAAQALAQVMTGQSAEYGRLKLEEHHGRTHLESYEPELYKMIFDASVNIWRDMENYRGRVTSFNGRLENDIGDDPAGRLALLETISKAGALNEASRPDEAEDYKAIAKLSASPFEESGFVKDSIRRLKDGQFDSLIAREVLTDEQHHPAIKNILLIAGIEPGSEGFEAGVERLSGVTGAWSEDAAGLIDTSREKLLTAVQTALEAARGDLESSLGIVTNGTTAEQRFHQSMSRLEEAAQEIVRRKRIFFSQGRQAQVKTRPTIQISRPGMPGVQILTPEIRKEINNRLVYVDRDGKVFEQDSAEFAQLQTDYLEQFRGTPGLETDVSNVLDFLRQVDINKLSGREGIVRVREGDWRVEGKNGPQTKPLFRFKPKDAIGLPLRTGVMKDSRVLLTFVNGGTVGITGMVYRRDLVDFLKRAGINSGAE